MKSVHDEDQERALNLEVRGVDKIFLDSDNKMDIILTSNIISAVQIDALVNWAIHPVRLILN